MEEKSSATLNRFAEFISWLTELRKLASGNELWRKPITNGEWSLREMLTHFMYWDKNSLRMMVPHMEQDAKLYFVDIEEQNREAAQFAHSYTDFDTLIDDVIATRQELLIQLQEKYDESIQFTIDDEPFTFKTFVDVFIHHDEHHIKQVEAFLMRERSA